MLLRAQVILNMTNTHTITKIFIDTNVFVALEDENDSTHKRAIQLSEFLLKQHSVKFYTSSEVISETLTVISRKLGKEVAKKFIKKHKNSYMIDIFFDENLYRKTLNAYLKLKHNSVSFVDCSNTVIMRKYNIKYIFSFDEDFKKMGVELLSDAV